MRNYAPMRASDLRLVMSARSAVEHDIYQLTYTTTFRETRVLLWLTKDDAHRRAQVLKARGYRVSVARMKDVSKPEFRGTVKGSRGEASRVGGRESGLYVMAVSPQGAVRVDLFEANGVDIALVQLQPHNGEGTSRILYEGPVSGKRKRKQQEKERELEARSDR